MKNKIKIYTLPIILFVLFLLFTLLVKFFNVNRIGDSDTQVGFSSINEFFFNLFKDTSSANIWYDISEYFGYFALATPLVFTAIGLYQLFKNKRISMIDNRLILLAFFYVTVILFYVVFEKVIINFRPILIDGELEASYPSSHTILSLCLIGSSILYFKRFISSNKTFNLIYKSISTITIIAILAGRLLSSMHWFTDIVGGGILSLSLLLFLNTSLQLIEKRK